MLRYVILREERGKKKGIRNLYSKKIKIKECTVNDADNNNNDKKRKIRKRIQSSNKFILLFSP